MQRLIDIHISTKVDSLRQIASLLLQYGSNDCERTFCFSRRVSPNSRVSRIAAAAAAVGSQTVISFFPVTV